MTPERKIIHDRYRKNNAERLKERYKKTSEKKNKWLWSNIICKCSVCEETDDSCMQFHHKNPENKIKEVATLFKRVNTDMTTTVDEIMKCVLVCANCHSKIHAGKINSENLKLIEVDRERMINSWDGRGCSVEKSRLGNNQYTKKFGVD